MICAQCNGMGQSPVHPAARLARRGPSALAKNQWGISSNPRILEIVIVKEVTHEKWSK